MVIIYLIVGGVVGFFVGGMLERGRKKEKEGSFNFGEISKIELGDFHREAKEALEERTEMRKKKILELIQSEEIHEKELGACNLIDRTPGVTSNEVKKLLDVSGRTARKYLNEMEGEKRIRQVGERGEGVYYEIYKEK